MFAIIEYIAGTFENVNLMCEEGEPILFGSEQTARLYAEKECAWAYKIVELN